MAPPSKRREGFSRRAQYTTFFGYAAGVFGAVLGLGLLLISIFNPGAFDGARAGASSVVEPAGGATARVREGGESIFEIVSGYATRGASVARMERELAEARSRLAQARAKETENRRLKGLLGLVEEDDTIKPVAVTRIVASTGSSARRLATIGAGSGHGVARGMPVRSDLGLIGRVLATTGSSALVLLVSDSQSLVPVRRAEDNVAAFAQGRGDGTLRVRLIRLGLNPLKKGDILVTSGSGGLYHPGTPLAVVEEILRDGAIARVLSDPGNTRFVIVEPASELQAEEVEQIEAAESEE